MSAMVGMIVVMNVTVTMTVMLLRLR